VPGTVGAKQSFAHLSASGFRAKLRFAPTDNRHVGDNPPVRFVLAFLLTLNLLTTAHADISGVEVTLASGEVVGKTRGLGTATVTAKVTNNTTRTLEGIRLAAFYSPVDVLPGADAQWLIHEFIFEPALAPGASSTLEFSDEGAAQYVLLDARAAKFRAALRYDGQDADLQFPVLKHDGIAYIALRDFAEVLGARLSSSGGLINIDHAGTTIRLKPLTAQAQVDGKPQPLSQPLLEDNGRTYIALRDAAELLGLTATDLGDDLYELK
jgi:hypothetical protein